MSDFTDYFKFIYSAAREQITGGADRNFLKRQRIRSETYFALLDFWNGVCKVLDEETHPNEFTNKIPALDEHIQTMSNKAEKIYGKFDLDVDYSKLTAPESLNQYVGGFFHRLLATGNESKKELGREIEEFWGNFFNLKRTAETHSKEKESDEDAYLDETSIALANYLKMGPLKAALEESEDKESSNSDFQADLDMYLRPEQGRVVLPRLAVKISEDVVVEAIADLLVRLEDIISEYLNGEKLLAFSPLLNTSIVMKLQLKARETRIELQKKLDQMSNMDMEPPKLDDILVLKEWLKDPARVNELAAAIKEHPEEGSDLTEMPAWSSDYERYAVVELKKMGSKSEMLIQTSKAIDTEGNSDVSEAVAGRLSKLFSTLR